MTAKSASSAKVHAKIRRAMERKVFASVAIIALLYFFFIVPDSIINLVLIRSNRFVTTAERLWTSLGGTIAITSILPFIFFASGAPFLGTSRTAKWVRTLFPSKAAEKRYNCDDAQATALWFEYFNTWGLPKSPRKESLEVSYAATYQARLIFYLVRTLLTFSVFGGVTILANWRWLNTYQGAGGKQLLTMNIFVELVYLTFLIFLVLANRGGTSTREPYGCWLRVKNKFGTQRALFEEDVLNQAKTLTDAHKLVAKLQKDYK